MEGYRNDFAGLLCFFLHNLCWVSSDRGKKENKKRKVNSVGLKELDQLMQEQARAINVCEEKNYQ